MISRLCKSIRALWNLGAERELDAFKKRAIDLGLPPDSGGVMLMKASKGDAKAFARMEAHLKSAIAAAKVGGLFKEFGATRRAEPLTAYEELMAKAREFNK